MQRIINEKEEAMREKQKEIAEQLARAHSESILV